jgi:hypothetical protein
MKKMCIVVATLFTAKAFLLDRIAHLGRKCESSVAGTA